MSIRWSLVAVGIVGAVVAVSAQSAPIGAPKPGPEHKRLEVFLGKWTGTGQAQASPYGPAAPVSSTDTFEWLPGGFFMAHHWDVKQGATIIKGMEIIGYDPKAKTYTSTFFDNAGNTGVFKATVQGDTWTWTGETEVAGKPLKERCTSAMGAPGTWMGKCEYSSDGTKWMPNFDIKNTKGK
jgi:hypothetical protein